MSGQILVVDDAATNRITLKVRLRAACYDPLTARTGAEAMAAIRHHQPMLVLIGGPPGDMDAVTLCARLTAEWPGLPVVMSVTDERRLAALRAGAAAVIDPAIDEMNLLARLRGLMRDQPQPSRPTAPEPFALAEAAAPFQGQPSARTQTPSVLLVAEDAASGVAWRHALSGRLAARIAVADPERALADATHGMAPDLYIIAADIAQPGDGLRLLAELRSRAASRSAAFAVAMPRGRRDMMSVALDLGAGDVVARPLDAAAAEEVALRLEALLRRKSRADLQRADAERERSLARADPLTGLPNRRHALPLLADLCRRAAEGTGSCAVIAIDIDRFKAVNDTLGHAAGDAVLQAVAERLRRAIEPSGVVARMGGEEFLAILPDLDEGRAADVAEAMRAAVSASPINVEGAASGVRVTLSAGVAGLARAAAEVTAAELLMRADAALMQAKRLGRDRLIVAGVGAAA